jgi:steroid delta-isomerase-like uncharacterized protein
MGIQENKDIVRRYYEAVLNGGDVDALDELVVLDYEEHDPIPGQGTGREGIKDRVRMLRGAFDPRFTIEDLVAEGDKVVARWINTGTHVGEFMGIPPTGRPYTIAGIDIHRIEGDRLAEHWHVVDLFGQMQQLGLLSQPNS